MILVMVVFAIVTVTLQGEGVKECAVRIHGKGKGRGGHPWQPGFARLVGNREASVAPLRPLSYCVIAERLKKGAYVYMSSFMYFYVDRV